MRGLQSHIVKGVDTGRGKEMGPFLLPVYYSLVASVTHMSQKQNNGNSYPSTARSLIQC